MKKEFKVEYEQKDNYKLSDLKDFEVKLLKRVLEICKEAKEKGNHPFGCLLADKGGNILMEQGNEEVSLNGDCTAHAEALLMRKASQIYTKEEMKEFTLYNCADSCAMCTGAMYWGNLGRHIYIARESELKKYTGDDIRNPTLNLPSRVVMASGQKNFETLGPFIELEDEFFKLHKDLGKILQLGVKTSAVMVLMPRMVSLLMEGLAPISEAANTFVQKRFPGREVNIGMDSALSVGHPAVLSSSLLLVPITILLAVILPGNTTLPFGDLATIPFVVCLMSAVFNGNIVRTVVGGSIYMTSILYITSWASPLVTMAAKAAKFDLGGNKSITAMAEGGLWPTWLFIMSGKYMPWIMLSIIFIVSLGGLYYVNKIKAKKEIKE